MYYSYDFYCDACNYTFNDLLEKDNCNPGCPKCGLYTEKILFNNPTVKSSADYKAIYKYVNGNKMADRIAQEKKQSQFNTRK